MSSRLRPVICIWGDEPFLVQQAVSQVRDNCLRDGYTREIFDVDTGFDWSTLRTAEQSLSLFAQKRLLEFKCAHFKLPDAGKKILQAYADSPAPDTVVLLWATAYESNIVKTKWFQTLSASAQVQTHRRLSVDQFGRWFRERAKAQSLNLSPQAQAHCLQALEGNLLAANQVLEKCQLLFAQQTISLDAIEGLVQQAMRYEVFDVVDAAFSGDAQAIGRMLKVLEAEGTPVLLLLGALMKHWREWLQVKRAVEHGASADQAMRQHRIWAKRQPLVKQTLTRHTYTQGLGFLRFAAKIERDFKQGEPVWPALAALLLGIAGHRALYMALEER